MRSSSQDRRGAALAEGLRFGRFGGGIVGEYGPRSDAARWRQRLAELGRLGTPRPGWGRQRRPDFGSDSENGNETATDKVRVVAHDGPEPASLAQLLYDHLAAVQAAVLEHRGEHLSVDVHDEQLSELRLAGALDQLQQRP